MQNLIHVYTTGTAWHAYSSWAIRALSILVSSGQTHLEAQLVQQLHPQLESDSTQSPKKKERILWRVQPGVFKSSLAVPPWETPATLVYVTATAGCPSLPARPTSCQYTSADSGTPQWTTTLISGMLIPSPKATVATTTRMWLSGFANVCCTRSLEAASECVWNMSITRFPKTLHRSLNASWSSSTIRYLYNLATAFTLWANTIVFGDATFFSRTRSNSHWSWSYPPPVSSCSRTTFGL